MTNLRIIAGLLVLLTTTSLWSAPPPIDYKNHINATLISDVSHIRAGRPFSIGVFLQIEPGWHIYWTNPGDAGLPTTIQFKGPEGFDIVPDPFPIPRKIRQGKENIYGYETPTCFTARVIPPADIRIGTSITFEASTSWLICKEECVPGKTTSMLTMQVSDHAGPVNIDAFQHYTSTVSGPKDRPMEVAGIQTQLDKQTHLLTLSVHWRTPCTGVQIFPGAADGVTLSKITVQKTEDNLTPITMKVEVAPGQGPKNNRLPLLISFRDSDGHPRGMEVTIPVK